MDLELDDDEVTRQRDDTQVVIHWDLLKIINTILLLLDRHIRDSPKFSRVRNTTTA
jgi:hypothetical protein